MFILKEGKAGGHQAKFVVKNRTENWESGNQTDPLDRGLEGSSLGK